VTVFGFEERTKIEFGIIVRAITIIFTTVGICSTIMVIIVAPVLFTITVAFSIPITIGMKVRMAWR